MAYRYRAEVLEQLWLHGAHPTSATPPQFVHDFVSDLYRYELRRLRHRLVTGEIPKAGYRDRVMDLRRRYPLLSLKAQFWAEDVPAGVGPHGTVGPHGR